MLSIGPKDEVSVYMLRGTCHKVPSYGRLKAGIVWSNKFRTALAVASGEWVVFAFQKANGYYEALMWFHF